MADIIDFPAHRAGHPSPITPVEKPSPGPAVRATTGEEIRCGNCGNWLYSVYARTLDNGEKEIYMIQCGVLGCKTVIYDSRDYPGGPNSPPPPPSPPEAG